MANKPTIPKKPTKADKLKRQTIMYLCIPVAILIFAFMGRPESKPAMFVGKDGKKEKLSKKHMPKQQFDQNEDAFEKFWTPEEKVFVDFVAETKRDLKNAVMAVVYKEADPVCKKLAKQLGKLMNINNELKIHGNTTVVGLDEKILSDNFKAQHKLDAESFPQVLLFAGANGINNKPALSYSGLPLMRDAVKRLTGWLKELDFNSQNVEKALVPKMSTNEVEKHMKKGNGVLNMASNAHVIYSCSSKLIKVLESVEEYSDFKQYVVEDSQNQIEDDSEYFFTRYVRQDSMLPASIVDAPITKTFVDAEEATDNVINSFRQLQVPVFSRLYPEALDSHLDMSKVLIVANQAIMGQDVLGNFSAAFDKFKHSVQFLYMYPADSPKEAKDWFGFQLGQRGMQVSLYTPKKEFVRFLGNLSNAEEFDRWIVKTLKKWRAQGVGEEEEEEEEEEEKKEEM